mgnify:CR=1 FL=1
MTFVKSNETVIAVIGLGYVGLPLALEFAKQYPTIGFDINLKRIKELKKVKDITLEVDAEDLSTVLVPCLGAFEQQSYGFLPTIDRMDISEANKTNLRNFGLWLMKRTV